MKVPCAFICGLALIRCVWSHQDLRRQHDEQVSLYKEELEHTFQAKVGNNYIFSFNNLILIHLLLQILQIFQCAPVQFFVLEDVCPWSEKLLVQLYLAWRCTRTIWHYIFLYLVGKCQSVLRDKWQGNGYSKGGAAGVTYENREPWISAECPAETGTA